MQRAVGKWMEGGREGWDDGGREGDGGGRADGGDDLAPRVLVQLRNCLPRRLRPRSPIAATGSMP